MFKMKIVGKEDLDILRKRIEKIEIELAKSNKKKIKKAKKR